MFNKAILVYITIQIIILVHEFGHYIFARYFKYNVTELNIGFGKKLLSLSKNNMDLNLRLLPLGGYVCIDNLGSSDKWIPATLTYLGGVIFNLLFAFICMIFVFNIGIISPKAKVTHENGEHFNIIKINDIPTKSWVDVNNLVLWSFLKKNNFIIVLNNKQKLNIQTANFENLFQNKWLKENKLSIWEPQMPPIILKSNYDQLFINDVILSVNEKEIKNNQDFKNFIQYNPNQLLKTKINRNKDIIYINLIPKPKKYFFLTYGYLDVELKQQSWPQETIIKKSYNIFNAIKYASLFVFEKIYLQYVILKNLIFGNLTIDMLSGPVGIYNVLYQSIDLGLVGFLYTISILSIAIAVINLVPIPPTDGFFIVIKSLESILCAKFSKRYLILLQHITLILIFLLLVNVTLNDIKKNLTTLKNKVDIYEV